MARDSLFGERIVWSGRAHTQGAASVPPLNKVTAAVSATLSVVSLLFAIVAGTGLQADVGGMVFFAGWCATIALFAWRAPIVWRARVEYLVTDKHVIWRRGPIRRSIERKAISYALIRWNPKKSGVGDLVVVRAVPTGALRRTLRLTLVDVEAPDRLWAIVRGVEPGAPLGDGDRPLAQRLDDGARVLWTARPLASVWSVRRVATAALFGVLALASVRMLLRAVPTLRRVFGVHALSPANLAMLTSGVALGAALLVAVALYVGYSAWVRPIRLARATRYWVTDRRVLIRRDHEELHLDRARIAYVIDAPTPRAVSTGAVDPGGGGKAGLHDVFLVLDGPQARALATSGAFGRVEMGADGDALAPVLSAIDDAETVGAILRRETRAEAA
jgi:hypothetical protein